MTHNLADRATWFPALPRLKAGVGRDDRRWVTAAPREQPRRSELAGSPEWRYELPEREAGVARSDATRMMSRFMTPKHERPRSRPVRLAIAGLAALSAATDHAGATGVRGERAIETVASRPVGEPLMAVISLRNQRITVYDANGWILRSPVSSGQRGRETPAGVFSVIQKNAEHYSNLYDDAYMPHMQRITWSGIALHGGLLPGYPASHGCVRLPFDFAARLFELTRMGMRVIVSPGDAAPMEIAHPALFPAKPRNAEAALARAAEAEAAARSADQARLAAVTAFRDVTRARAQVRLAENLQGRAEAQLAAAEAAIGSATSPEARLLAEDAKSKIVARIAELQAQRAAAMTELQPKLALVATTREAAIAAEAAHVAATEAARQAARELEPISIFVSRKSERLYVRRSFQPILESPVTVVDSDRPIGTHVFTAVERADRDGNMRWSVVSLTRGRAQAGSADVVRRAHAGRDRDGEPIPPDARGGRAALDRIVVPPEALDRISEMVSPRSALIISDEALSSETGKDTDFVIVLSDEPQGSLKIRRSARAPAGRPPLWGSTW